MTSTTAEELLEGYDCLLLDAYGVLVDRAGALPHASAFIAELNRRGYPYFIVTNDASRLPQTISDRFAGFGMDVAPLRIVTSGGLLPEHFAQHRLEGKGCFVLGPTDSEEYVRASGGRVLSIKDETDPDVIVVCDESGYPLLDSIDATLTAMVRSLDAGRELHCVQPNPDLIYPRGPGSYGITAGGVVAIFEKILAERYGQDAPSFVRLGKPHAPIFAEAKRRAGEGRLAMVGDQLATDIAGAAAAGIDAILVGTGVAIADAANDPRVTAFLPSLALSLGSIST